MRHDHHGRILKIRYDPIQRDPQQPSLFGTRSQSLKNLRRTTLLPHEPRPIRKRSHRNDRHGLRRTIHQRTTNGIRRRAKPIDKL